MIAELFRYWTTFAPERVRKYGYLQRLIALEFREARCRDVWMEHVEKTKALIVKAADLVPRQRTAVIVGSGLLIEVPMQELADRFERIYLADIFHMPAVRERAKRYFNVKLLTGDITGIFQMMKEGHAPGPLRPAPNPRIPHLADADFIVSCNCLTQLAGPFNDFFRKERGFADKDCDTLAAQVMEEHVQAIATKATSVSVLITDTERFAMQDDSVVARTDLLKGVRLPQSSKIVNNEEWDWLLAPAPEEHPSHDMVHVVNGRIYEHHLPEEQKDKVETPLAATPAEGEGELPPNDGR